MRKEYWGYDQDEDLAVTDLHKVKYAGIRPAFGYPSLPDPTEMASAWRTLNVEKETGITLTEGYAMRPAASVSGLYFAHPEASYFSVGKVDKEQVAEYAKRKGLEVREVEKWLCGNLAYDNCV